jgi:hypothetical protein
MKDPTLRYAVTDEGLELPVIDVTHAAFRLELGKEELDAEMQRAVATVQRHAAMPAAEQHEHMQTLTRGSYLAPRIAAAQGTVLSGMSTYFLKLGPDNLGAWASPLDRTIAGSMPCLSCRVRLQNTAHMIAEGLARSLEARVGAPLAMLNIAGGPGMDSLNALIVLRSESPKLLENREIEIRILDIDDAGPRFGSRALSALRADAGPLSGLPVSFEHVHYDWCQSAQLGPLFAARSYRAGIVAGSSEGGLFDYASDEQILANLRELEARTPDDAFFVGSVSRGDGSARILNEAGRAAIHLRTLQDFSALVAAAGWRVARVAESPLSRELMLVKYQARSL